MESTTIRISPKLNEFIHKNGRFGENHSDVLERFLFSESNVKDAFVKPENEIRLDAENEITFCKLPITIKKKRGKGYGVEAKDYETFLCEILKKYGSISTQKAYRLAEAVFKHKFNKLDLSLTKDGQLQWKNRLQWARQQLCDDGIMDNSERGVWKLK